MDVMFFSKGCDTASPNSCQFLENRTAHNKLLEREITRFRIAFACNEISEWPLNDLLQN